MLRGDYFVERYIFGALREKPFIRKTDNREQRLYYPHRLTASSCHDVTHPYIGST